MPHRHPPTQRPHRRLRSFGGLANKTKRGAPPDHAQKAAAGNGAQRGLFMRNRKMRAHEANTRNDRATRKHMNIRTHVRRHESSGGEPIRFRKHQGAMKHRVKKPFAVEHTQGVMNVITARDEHWNATHSRRGGRRCRRTSSGQTHHARYADRSIFEHVEAQA